MSYCLLAAMNSYVLLTMSMLFAEVLCGKFNSKFSVNRYQQLAIIIYEQLWANDKLAMNMYEQLAVIIY